MYIKLSELKARLRGRWPDFIGRYAPQLQEALDRAPHHGPCPVYGGKDNFRFMPDFRDTGGAHSNKMGDSEFTKKGVFRSGIDVLRFYNGWDMQTTVRAACEFLGIPHDAPEGTSLPKPQMPPKVKATPLYNDFSIQKMTEWWKAGCDLGMSDMAISYLDSRKLLSVDIPHKGVLRFNPSIYYGKDDGGKIIDLPAILAYIQDPEGNGVGLHRTYIDWKGKANVEEPRKLMTPIKRGAYTGAAIRLYDLDGRHLGLAEGIETAMAVRAATGQPVWSTTNRGMLEIIQVPKEVRSVDIWMDNDRSGDGEHSAKIAAERLEAEGVHVRLFKPPKVGTDWCDVWVERGQTGFPREVLRELERQDRSESQPFFRPATA